MMTNDDESVPEDVEFTAEGLRIELADLARVALEPGDVLLLRSQVLTQAQVALVKMRLTQAFPGHEIVMISKDVEVSVMRPVTFAVTDPCGAQLGEPCVLTLECELSRDHDGNHHATFEW